MKKQLMVCGISILLVTGTAYNLSAQKEKKNDKKENSAKEEKQPGKGNSGNAQNGNGKSTNNGKGNGNNNGNGNNGNNAVKKNGNNGNGNKYGNNGNGNGNKENKNYGDDFAGNGKNLKGNQINYYNWTPETFKDRKKVKNQDKVSICHKFNGNNEPAVNIRVSANAAKAHINHGDVMGDCPVVNNTNFSDIFLRRRSDYFTSIENSREELMYSRSIYDYALLRLSNSRIQLATLQANQLSQAEINRKQATVVELEQNVSLLETLIGVAANLLVSKLQ